MQNVMLTTEELRKLLSCGCPDAGVLYLYRRAGEPLETALEALHFTPSQMVAARDCLRQLGLWEEQQPIRRMPPRPAYTGEDVQRAMAQPAGTFPKLVGEAQRRLGRTISTQETITLLSFTEYLRLPEDVIGLLLSYCVERARRRGQRAPTMHTIEKEAYRWADEGIDTLEAACFFCQSQLAVHGRISQLRLLLQIDQRRLTPAEEQYLRSWIDMGFGDDAIRLAYERTCLNTGGLKWAYMNSILRSWHEKNLHTVQQIQQGDQVPPQLSRRGGEQFQRHTGALSDLEREAVARALAEGREG